MSHPPFWLSKQFFYPIGNTSAFSLTQDLSPEQSADILLLGCGDPRHILFTIYSDLMAGSDHRKLDITCCDIEPAVLARNVLLFALIDANEPIDRVWNIFYHFKIDDQSLQLLTRHSKQLYENSQNMDSWRSSRYNDFLKMIDSRTLNALNSHWKKYAEFDKLPSNHMKQFHKEQADLSKYVTKTYGFNYSPSRSAGMLWHEAMSPVSALFRKYWETGTTFTLASEVKSAKNLNPTFLYSLSGDKFNPHYGTFPMGFHIITAFAPVVRDPAGPLPTTGSAVISVSKQQFKAWASSFRVAKAANSVIIRFYSGEAIAFCRALRQVALTGEASTNLFVSPWLAPQIKLDELPIKDSQYQTSFDVIDTSNLTDHLGLLNLLIVAQPLLKKVTLSQSVLYTETLLPSGEDATQSFLTRLCTDVPTLGTLLGIVPRAYTSAFTTHSNVHELMASTLNKDKDEIAQFHERVAWVAPAGGDRYSIGDTQIALEPEDLARALFGIYDHMFANENIMASLFAKPSVSGLRTMGEAHFHRESAALLFNVIRSRVCVRNGTWDQAMDKFLEIVENSGGRMTEMNNYQDLCLQLYLHGVFTVDTLKPELQEIFRASPRAKLFDQWPNVPPVVCVVLTVPRKSLKVFFDDPEHIGSPTLQAFLRVDGSHDNTYSAIHPVWGKCTPLPGSDEIIVQEDPDGMLGKSDLVVSFWTQTRILEFPGTYVALGVKTTPQTTMMFMGSLGMQLEIFRASVTNRQHVHILPYRPTLASEPSQSVRVHATPDQPPSPSTCQAIVGKDNAGRVSSFSMRLDIESEAEQESLLHGVRVAATQIAPCTMKLSFGKHSHLITYPYPIQGYSDKLRVARKSHYIELITPISRPFDEAGYFLNPFPVIERNAHTPWNVHHLQLDRLPVLDTKISRKVEWLNPHTALQMSDQEKSIRNGASEIKKEASAQALMNVKDSIHAIVMNVSGVQGHRTRALGLCEPGNGGVYVILLVGGIRLDLASLTIVVDTAIVPLSNDRMHHLGPGIQKLMGPGDLVQIVTKGHEVTAWKRLIPAYVERCRTWKHKPNCEYRSQGFVPLSTQIDENPICTCGQGIGFGGPDWKVAEWKALLPFATRAAISPIFSVSYVERVMGELKDQTPSAKGRPGYEPDVGVKPPTACWACGGPGKPNLSACSRCKKARYCSPACQHQDWKEHKKGCHASS